MLALCAKRFLKKICSPGHGRFCLFKERPSYSETSSSQVLGGAVLNAGTKRSALQLLRSRLQMAGRQPCWHGCVAAPGLNIDDASRADELSEGELRRRSDCLQGRLRLLSAGPFGRVMASFSQKAMFLCSLVVGGLLVFSLALNAWCQGAPGRNCATRLPASHRSRLRKEAQSWSAAFA